MQFQAQSNRATTDRSFGTILATNPCLGEHTHARTNIKVATKTIVPPVAVSKLQDKYIPRIEEAHPIAGAKIIIFPSRSVSNRAVAAGVIKSAKTSTFPIICTDTTTAIATKTYSIPSNHATGNPIARLVSRSIETHTSSLWNIIKSVTIISPVIATTAMSESGIPVMEPNRNDSRDPA